MCAKCESGGKIGESKCEKFGHFFKKFCLFLRLFPKGACVTDLDGASYLVKDMHVESGNIIALSQRHKKINIIQEFRIKTLNL